jgi:hypothetical protein
MSTGVKHLVKCRCVLPQFKSLHEPPVHQFVVFSVVDDSDKVQIKFAQCNNCGVIHKVTDICRSEILMNKEDMGSLLSINDISQGLPQNLVKILESNSCDLPTWEACSFIVENKQWGNFVVLTTDAEHGTRQGKYVQIIGENMFKVNTFTREEFIKG